MLSSLDNFEGPLGKFLIYFSLAIAIFLGCSLTYCIYTFGFGPYRRIPGPRVAKLTGFWELWHLRKGSFEKKNIELHRQYGPVVQVAPNRFSIDDPQAVKTIYGHGNSLVKAEFYHAFGDPVEPNIFSVTDKKDHAAQRRSIANLYSMTTLLSYEAYVNECTAIITSKLEAVAKEQRTIPMVPMLQFYAFDVIGMITFGERFGFLEAERDFNGIIGCLETLTRYSSSIGLFPYLHDRISLVTRSLGMQPPFKKISDHIQGHLDRHIDSHDADEKVDFLSRLLKLRASGKNSDFDTFNSCGNNIAAGSDTTAISLSGTLYYLLQYPRTLATLREEIDDNAARGRVSDPITYQEAQALPYLQAVIKESLRIHPAVGLMMPRVVPRGGLTIAETYLPEGAEVGINPWVAHRNRQVFGQDADEFRPERWLAENNTDLDGYFLSFGFGSRTCIGKNISLLEMTKAIPQLVRHFDFEITNAAGKWETRNTWFVKQKYECRIKKRPT